MHVYLQNPPTHFFGVALEPQSTSVEQFGVGRVSTTHAPWLQNLPLPQSLSVAQAATHAPPTHCGVAPEHSLSVAQPPPTGLGSQTPFAHVKPAPHVVVSHVARHWPSAQTLPSAHSLEYLQTFAAAVHEPAWQVSPDAQSVAAVHGHGPAVPPQASHFPLTQVPPLQSAFVVQSVVVPGSIVGAVQRFDLQTSPEGQVESSVQEVVQPVDVQVSPALQLEVPVQAGCAGAVTVEQP